MPRTVVSDEKQNELQAKMIDAHRPSLLSLDSTKTPLSFWKNPLSVFGELLGLVAYFGVLVQEAQLYLTSDQAYSMPVLIVFAIGALLLSAAIFACVSVQLMSLCDKKEHRD